MTPFTILHLENYPQNPTFILSLVENPTTDSIGLLMTQ
ncbi:hypothetical protein STRDD10_01342 [Streptococcus sp. DD10]|nr:hypothetical protein STRDD10_01342 [Streptococcus sp. DD10]